MLTIAQTTACTVVLMIIFPSIPVHVNRNVTMALNKVNCSLWFKVSFLLSAQSFDFWTFCKMTSLRVSLLSDFRLGRLFQVFKTEYDLLSRFGLTKPFRLVYCEVISLTYSFAYIIWLCMISFAAFCGLVVHVVL